MLLLLQYCETCITSEPNTLPAQGTVLADHDKGLTFCGFERSGSEANFIQAKVEITVFDDSKNTHGFECAHKFSAQAKKLKTTWFGSLTKWWKIGVES